MPYWRRDRLRNDLKALKKKLDDVDRQKKASVVQDVCVQSELCYYMDLQITVNSVIFASDSFGEVHDHL